MILYHLQNTMYEILFLLLFSHLLRDTLNIDNNNLATSNMITLKHQGGQAYQIKENRLTICFIVRQQFLRKKNKSFIFWWFACIVMTFNKKFCCICIINNFHIFFVFEGMLEYDISFNYNYYLFDLCSWLEN